MIGPRWLRAVGHAGRLPEVARCASQVRNWVPFTRRYLKAGGGYPFRIQVRAGYTFELLDWADVTTAWVVFGRREYRVPAAARTVLDLGANFGGFAVSLAVARPGVRVLAVEPSAVTFARLQAHVTAAGLADRVTVRRSAVAATVSLRVLATAGPSHSHALTDGPGEPVEAVPLGDLLAAAPGGGPIDFLKVDVEGAEHETFAAVPTGGLDRVGRIGVEYHQCGPKQRLFADLSRLGFRCVHDRPFAPDFGVAHFDPVRRTC